MPKGASILVGEGQGVASGATGRPDMGLALPSGDWQTRVTHQMLGAATQERAVNCLPQEKKQTSSVATVGAALREFATKQSLSY